MIIYLIPSLAVFLPGCGQLTALYIAPISLPRDGTLLANQIYCLKSHDPPGPMEDANKGVAWCVFLVNCCSRHRAEGIHSKWTTVVKTCMVQSLREVSGYPVAGTMRERHIQVNTHTHTHCTKKLSDRSS